MSIELIVQVTAYRGVLIFKAPEDDSCFEHPDWTCDIKESPKCSIQKTKNHLGISPDAEEILRALREEDDHGSTDASGEIGWSMTDGISTFSWSGYPMAIMGRPLRVSAGYLFRDGEYVRIPNKIDHQARYVIDASMGPIADASEGRQEDKRKGDDDE